MPTLNNLIDYWLKSDPALHFSFNILFHSKIYQIMEVNKAANNVFKTKIIFHKLI